MFSSTTISLKIDPAYRKNVYSSGDVIKGVIQLNVPKDISLTAIDVKLEGISKASANFRRQHQTDKRITVTESHRFLFQQDKVFPPKNIQAVTHVPEFDLIAGEYSYPFAFTFPDLSDCFSKMLPGLTDSYGRNCVGHYYGHVNHKHCTLPPSFNYRNANIRYFLKVTARRSALLKTNLREIVPFIFLPDDSLVTQGMQADRPVVASEVIEFSDKRVGQIFQKSGGVQTRKECLTGAPRRRRSIFSFGKGSDDAAFPASTLHATFSFVLSNGAMLTPGRPIDLQMFLSATNPSQFFMDNGETNLFGRICLTYLEIQLARNTYYSVGRKSVDGVVRTTVFESKDLNLWLDLADAQVSDNLSELRIPTDFLQSAILPSHLPPTFGSCNINTDFVLIITARFGDTDHRPKKVRMSFPVRVLSGINRTIQYPPTEGNLLQEKILPGSSKADAPAPLYTPQEPEQLPSYQTALTEATTSGNEQSRTA